MERSTLLSRSGGVGTPVTPFASMLAFDDENMAPYLAASSLYAIATAWWRAATLAPSPANATWTEATRLMT